ncbi:hypothetical protein NIIDMKKI_40600 [Mycobacterium kansasii]|uniref:Uncharacterized protein n=1 Tax=Mycobacterium kansasii TaxID=1768 RepID=A0A7G1IEK0_MYCKA|nr:hypothetical protein NIIDMKKI_40600 [Mycobacterium kansasii]
MFAQAVLGVATGLRQRNRLAAVHQRVVHLADLQEDGAEKCRIEMYVVNADADGEVIVMLDHAESEAIPIQGTRGAQDVFLPLVRRHLAVLNRLHFDSAGIGHGMADYLTRTGDRKPAAVGVMATKVRVDDVGHRADIAVTDDIEGNDQKP